MPKAQKGFTLIEILVGLTIISLIFGFGFVSFREFSRRQSIFGTAKNMRGDLRLAQETAQAGKKPEDTDCDSPNVLIGYNFNILSPSQYRIEAVCSGGTVNIKTVDLPSDINMTTPSPNPILFKILGSGTNVDGASNAQIVLSQTGTSNTQTIEVSVVGEIK